MSTDRDIDKEMKDFKMNKKPIQLPSMSQEQIKPKEQTRPIKVGQLYSTGGSKFKVKVCNRKKVVIRGQVNAAFWYIGKIIKLNGNKLLVKSRKSNEVKLAWTT